MHAPSLRCRIPLYYELKLCAIIWLIAPQTRGAQVVYKEAVYPLLHKYASQFDPTFSSDGKVRGIACTACALLHEQSLSCLDRIAHAVANNTLRQWWRQAQREARQYWC